MGMDIYGINPRTAEGKPTEPNENATSEERAKYLNSLWEWNENSGHYFRANFWSWVAILSICEITIDIFKLPLDTKGWASNSGYGLKTQEDCEILASAIEAFFMLNKNMKDDDDSIHIVTQLWTDSNGKFLPEKTSKKLTDTYKLGQILYNKVVLEDGTIARPCCYTNKSHVLSFVKFLRSCGGFEIC